MDAELYRDGRSHTGLGLFATMPIKKHALIVGYSGPRIPTVRALPLAVARISTLAEHFYPWCVGRACADPISYQATSRYS